MTPIRAWPVAREVASRTVSPQPTSTVWVCKTPCQATFSPVYTQELPTSPSMHLVRTGPQSKR
eukprot:4189636-Amphidinium_carterae.2